MRREYVESMSSSGFDEFFNACEELKNCKYVIAESKIAALLKSIADNKQVCSLFVSVLKDFDYDEVFDECFYERGFSLPNDLRKMIALVFRILLDIDRNKRSLKDFLNEYFYSESINEAFARFVLEMVTPFETYCRTYFEQQTDIPNDIIAIDDEQTARVPTARFREELKADALRRVAELIEIGDDSITRVIDRDEYRSCLDGLDRALRFRDYADVKSAFFGVKYAVSYFFGSSETIGATLRQLEHDIGHLED